MLSLSVRYLCPVLFFFFSHFSQTRISFAFSDIFFCFSPRGSLWSLFFVPIFHFLISNLPRPHVKLNKMIHIEEEPIKFIENEQNMTLIFETDRGHYRLFSGQRESHNEMEFKRFKINLSGSAIPNFDSRKSAKKIKQLHHETFIKRKKNLRGKVKYELTFMLHRI